MLLKKALASSRYLALIAIAGVMVGSVSLLLYEAFVIATAIEAIDVFLIAIVAQIIGIGLYVLFIDETLPVQRWLKIENLDDLKSHLVSSVIAVLAVLFMREAVAWDGQRDLLGLGAALALVIAALSLYLAVKSKGKH